MFKEGFVEENARGGAGAGAELGGSEDKSLTYYRMIKKRVVLKEMVMKMIHGGSGISSTVISFPDKLGIGENDRNRKCFFQTFLQGIK